MRPRVFPAEDCRRPRNRERPEHGFNEAAGIPRGRPFFDLTCVRPAARFNEAAGIPRGRRTDTRTRWTSPWRFNEAAGIPRGRHRGRRGPSQSGVASMRPRVFPAEDVLLDTRAFIVNLLQ